MSSDARPTLLVFADSLAYYGPTGGLPADDPRIVKELQVTTYHVLWELVHVFFEQPGVLDPEVIA